MKKTITFFAFALCVSINAQTNPYVADFEGFTLPASSSYSSSTSAPFVTTNASFEFNFSGGYWVDGFSYTNVYDSTTAGYMNTFGVKALKGYNNSSMFVVSQGGGKIKLKAPYTQLDGFYVTNTTYAYKSMKTGDAFAKKFGGVSGNDPDYFGFTIKGFKNGTLKTDTVNFYLADFRFSNNAQDYIVKDWQFLNTSSLGAVDSVYFTMFSSDKNSAGILTPAYFAMDNFTTSYSTVGIAENSANQLFSMYPNPAQNVVTVNLNKNGNTISAVTLSDVSGKIVYNESMAEDRLTLDITSLQSGVYFIIVQSAEQKTVKKLIKN